MEHDLPNAHKLSARMIYLENEIGLGRKVAMKARRFCRTEMLSRGVPVHVVNAQMGHDSETGRAHYEDSEAIVERHYSRAEKLPVNGSVNGSEHKRETV